MHKKKYTSNVCLVEEKKVYTVLTMGWMKKKWKSNNEFVYFRGILIDQSWVWEKNFFNKCILFNSNNASMCYLNQYWHDFFILADNDEMYIEVDKHVLSR